MPTLHGPLRYTGTIDELVAYQMKGSDKTIVRRKAFITKGAYQKEPQYAAMRRNSAEFAICARAGKMVRTALPIIMRLTDQNMTPVLQGFCKILQKKDNVHPHGERPVLFSMHKEALTSLPFTKRHLFDSVWKQRPVATLLREKTALHIQIGELLPGFNFQLPWQKPYFRIIASLAAIQDVYADQIKYPSILYTKDLPSTTVFSDWMMAKKTVPAHCMNLQLENTDLIEDAGITWVGAIGIEMGEPDLTGTIQPVKYACTARILVTG
ncbi:MAG: hypothetical protein ACO1NK_12225 [Sediminibacterium sp.]